MIEIPKPNPQELIGDYLKRLLTNNIINASQIPLAIQKFNSK